MYIHLKQTLIMKNHQQKKDPKVLCCRRVKNVGIALLLTLSAFNVYASQKSHVLISGVSQSDQGDRKITGVVVDATNEPIIGANVVVKGTTIGVITDVDGKFTLDVPAKATLQISFIGYISQELKISNKESFSIQLVEDSQALEEVVVVGFGTQKKASVVGAVQTINAKELKIPSSNLSNAFAGRIAGVTSFQRSGEPGADGSTFYIRGISTFAGPTNPLIFIDGVEVSTNDMNALAPEVIEGFSVLKDATATALYGARGANGVMLITTKQGSEMEKAKINIRVENSFSQPTQMIKLANGLDYMAANNEALRTRGITTPRFSKEKIDATRQGLDPIIYPNVDWYDLLFRDFSVNQSANLNVTGGTKKITYFLSASVNNDNGMLKKDPQNNFDNNINQLRFSFQGNISAKLTNTTKVGLRINSQIIDYKGSASKTSDLYTSIFYAPPTLFPAFIPSNEGHTAFGNIMGGPRGTGLYYNPYAEMVKGYKDNNQSTVITSFDVEQDLSFFTKGLKVKGLISFKNWTTTDVLRSFSPFYYEIDENNPINADKTYNYDVITKGTTYLGTSTSSGGDRLLNLQLSLDYNRNFGKHDVSGMLVYLQRDYNNNAPDGFYASLPTRNQGIAGRGTYGYDNRYMIEANFGYNGSENFAEGNRFGFFPSIAVGYNISNESYFEPFKHFISNLKIRASYGIVGNSFTDPRFPYITDVNLTEKGYIFGDNWQTNMNGAVINKYGTDNAKWETGKKTNIGLDLNLFNCLNIVVDAFHEKRNGIFMQRQVISAESGVVGNNPYANLGKVKNQGIDISLDYNKAISKDFIINLRGTLTYNKNELLDRDEPQLPYAYLSAIGKPLNRHTGLIAEGLYTEEDIKKGVISTYTPHLIKAGDIKYKDLNEDGKIDNNDMTQIGNPTIPQLVYGFGGSLQYKQFDFGLFFQGIGNVSLMMASHHPYTADESVLFDWIAQERWTEENPNPNAIYPRLISKAPEGFNNYQKSTYWLRNAAFLRLKNVELGYTYKKSRIYISGQNLLTFSPFKYWDPEQGGLSSDNAGNGLGYPPSKIINIGLQLNF